jgi:hypothetical protein
MWFIFESALVNSWVLYKTTFEAAGKEVPFSHFQFRKAVALGLAKEWEDMGCRPNTFKANSPAEHFKCSKRVRMHLGSKSQKLFDYLRFSDTNFHSQALKKCLLWTTASLSSASYIVLHANTDVRLFGVTCAICHSVDLSLSPSASKSITQKMPSCSQN